MGANLFYDAMHQVLSTEERADKDPVRRVELFVHASQIWLRLGPLGDQHAGKRRYSARLTLPQAVRLMRALEESVAYTRDFGA